ncbi:Ubiquinone biosynthesis O-methyltransferase [Macleaya cordata]|uniref:Ubiquinone biosynthesis O-methyltransferase, mitochondrial n=1 Tax=Macleaya cordata TaxID=56857 RepID=A0A200PTC5_MACCD|nr:Ubiquinone biosynthesis O-methyltransferase [Macleaya cordata]
MASNLLKLCRALHNTSLREPFLNPNRKLPLQFPISRASSQILQIRSYSDIPQQPASIDPSSVPPLSSPNEDTPAPKLSDKSTTAEKIRVSSSLNEFELAKFSAIAETWWDSEGPFKPLHAMNPTRLSFVRSTLCRHFGKDPYCARPLEGLKIVDVGCGGGILSEPLARMGAIVTGIDAVEKNIKIASLHAELDPVTAAIEYRCVTAEKLVEEQRKFDAVIALEVIEHVSEPAEFCKSLAALCVTNGATLISTINRTIRSYAAAIVTAEYILHWLPKGTHQWSSLVTPEELALILHRASISVQEVAGIVFNPLTGKWVLSDDNGLNGQGDLFFLFLGYLIGCTGIRL